MAMLNNQRVIGKMMRNHGVFSMGFQNFQSPPFTFEPRLTPAVPGCQAHRPAFG